MNLDLRQQRKDLWDALLRVSIYALRKMTQPERKEPVDEQGHEAVVWYIDQMVRVGS